MTNELAIRILKGDVLGTSEQTHEAIKMAVKALSLPSAKPEITNEEIRFALKQLGAYFSIKIRDKKEGDVPVELLQRIGEIQEYVDNLPSAQPERKNGKWIEDKEGCLICSLCGNSAEINCISGEFMETNYCSECGADMRGEEE